MAVKINTNDSNWVQTAGFDFHVERRPIMAQGVGTLTRQVALVRDDTNEVLGIVGKGYKVHQPADIVRFFDVLAQSNGMRVDAAGISGSKIWARAHRATDVYIADDDVIKTGVLLATSFDGSLATVAKEDSSRIVCDNRLAIVDRGGVRIPHSSDFDERRAAQRLNLTGFERFITDMRKLAAQKTKNEEAFFRTLLDLKTDETSRPFNTLLGIYRGEIESLTTPSARGTWWGMLSAVTYYVDHVRGSDAAREAQSTFGAGAALKVRAKQLLLENLPA